jgi:hypothetical protein
MHSGHFNKTPIATRIAIDIQPHVRWNSESTRKEVEQSRFWWQPMTSALFSKTAIGNVREKNTSNRDAAKGGRFRFM